MMRHANVLDPIEQQLDQTVYKGITPRKSVQDFINRIYYRALDKELAVNGERWATLYLTGSLTTYQYSVTSDCDVSVFPDYDLLFKDLGLSPDEARKKLIHLSIEHLDGTFLPGTTHPLQFFVVPHGTLPGDLYKPGLRSAFDLHDSVWFQKPEKDRVHDIAVEYPDLFKRAEDIGDKLTQMLDAGDDDAARELWHQIHKKRQLDQQAGLGDFCEGNIVYKYLLNEGLFDRIRSELGEYIGAIEEHPTELDEGHADTRIPWIYVPETDRLVIGSPGSSHRQMSKLVPEADQGTEWYGAYGETTNRVTIFSQYDFDDFREEDIDPDLIRNLREAWSGASIWYNDQDGDRQEYNASNLASYVPKQGLTHHKWRIAMPPASEWNQFADDLEDRQIDGQRGEAYFINETGLRWKFDRDTLKTVTHLLGTAITFDVSRGWMEGYGKLAYRILPGASGNMYTFSITINQMLSPEAASYSLWHEIQHAFQLVEGRMDAGHASPNRLTPDVWGDYINNPVEIDADEMAAQMQKIQELPVVEEISVIDGSEKEYYEELLSEGWPQDEAFDMLTKGDEEITLDHVLKSRSSKWKKADLWEDRVTQKVLYDFDKDTITLGTQATEAADPNSKIIGEYVDGAVTLFGVEKQWISPQYFHRLWAFSYPDKELKDVYYKRDEGNIKLRTVRPTKRSNAPKFLQGDNVIMKGYGEGGTIAGEPYFKDSDQTWWYLVKTYDGQGPKDEILVPESDMERPSRYDQPGEMTLKDMFGIPPEGEDYFRNAKQSFDDITQRMFDAAPVQEQEARPKWTPQVPDAAIQMAIYKHRCPNCGGYLQDRGGVYTCQSCPFEWDANTNDFGGTNVG